MHLVKPSGNQKEQETKQSHFHQSDVMDDAVKVERGELIARKDHTTPKHSCSYVKEDNYSSVNMNKQFFVQLACMFMVIGVVVACLLHTQEVPGSIPGRGSYLRQVSLH